MSNFFNYLKKIFPKQKTEKKAKEEEDINTDLNLNIEIKKSDLYEKLEYIVSGIKIRDANIDNFDTYLKKLNKIISAYNKDENELNYRYKLISTKEEKMIEAEVNDIEKMKTIGKIGTEPTILDTNSASGNFNFSYNRLKISAKDSFPSIRGSNAVFKGKFFYEVQVLSNRLMQIGWCTLQTPFKAQDGVGDDLTSYAFDGYRLCKWHNGKETYGQYWDSGDFIGVCIDLDEKKIEYFRNGVSLGIAFTNIPVGENIAYFPGISLSIEEEIVFNFGKLPFHHQYPGYEPMDLPDCLYTNSLEITSEMLILLKNHILKLIQLNDINFVSKIMISNKIFDFLINVSFKDLYVLKNCVIPFLCELSTGDLEVFFNFLLKFIVNNEKIEFVIYLFENICGFIEETALRGLLYFNDWKNLINLFSNLLKIEEVCYLWLEGRKYIENFKAIFNSNAYKFNELYEFFKKNVDPKEHSFYSAMKSYKKVIMNDDMQKYEILLSEEMSNFISRFVEDTKNYKIKNRSMSLQSIIFEFFDFIVEKFQNNANQNNIMGMINFRDNTLNRENERMLKNAIFSLFGLFTKLISLPLSDFSIDQWFSRLNSGSFYYDEIGVGGTISHVTSEYGSHVNQALLPKNENIQSILFHRILKVFQIVLPMLKLYSKNFEKTKLVIGSFDKIFEMGYDIIDKVFKFNFSIFTNKNQEILYSIGYFLVNLLNTYVTQNNYLLYFIPIFTTDIPFEIFKFLLNCKSSILRNSYERKHLTENIIHFKEDNFTFQIVYFYTYLFADQSIANPELKESFLSRIKYFVNKKRCLKIYEESSVLVSYLIKGILHFMSIDSYASISSEIFLKIIQPGGFGEKPENLNKNQVIIENIICHFKSDDLAFTKFLDPFNKYLNLIMTEFSLYLREVNKIMNSTGIDENENKQSIIRKFRYSFNSLVCLMKIFEFLLLAYPKPFLDTNSISFSYLSSYLKNLCNRIVEKNYFDQIKKFFEKFKSGNLILYEDNVNDGIHNILMPIIGLFLNITKSLNYDNYNNFLSKIANLSDLDLDPFLDIYEIMKSRNILSEQDIVALERYKQIIDQLISLIKRKSDRKMSLEEWEKATKNDDICILCYTNPKDRILLPCKHDCCGDCLIQYLHSKKTCFICNATIESVEEINK